MNLQAQSLQSYLVEDDVVDHSHPAVAAWSDRLRIEHPDDAALARAAFEQVRDRIQHALDAGDSCITLLARGLPSTW
jgi:hypothetical protein